MDEDIPIYGQMIGIKDVEEIAERIEYRQRNFPGEEFSMSLGVVLLNYGDQYIKVWCVDPECGWEGLKRDIIITPELPTCPNGHPLLERDTRMKLGWVREKI